MFPTWYNCDIIQWYVRYVGFSITVINNLDMILACLIGSWQSFRNNNTNYGLFIWKSNNQVPNQQQNKIVWIIYELYNYYFAISGWTWWFCLFLGDFVCYYYFHFIYELQFEYDLLDILGFQMDLASMIKSFIKNSSWKAMILPKISQIYLWYFFFLRPKFAYPF